MFDNISTFLIAVLFLVGCFGCNPEDQRQSYIKTIESARGAVPTALQIETFFPDTKHSITHYGIGNASTNTWHSVVYLYGRYRFHMNVQVKVDYENNTVEQIGQPKFMMYEYSKAYDVYGDGIVYGADVGTQSEFSLQQWNIILQNDGDFSSIGINLEKEKPIKDFDKFAAISHRDLIHVKLKSRTRAEEADEGSDNVSGK